MQIRRETCKKVEIEKPGLEEDQTDTRDESKVRNGGIKGIIPEECPILAELVGSRRMTC